MLQDKKKKIELMEDIIVLKRSLQNERERSAIIRKRLENCKDWITGTGGKTRNEFREIIKIKQG